MTQFFKDTLSASDLSYPKGLENYSPSFIGGLASLLQNNSHVINLCHGRHAFLSVFCATLVAKGENLLPQNKQPKTLAALLERFPSATIVTDASEKLELPLDCKVINLSSLPNFDLADETQGTFYLEPNNTAARVYSSGSTGEPKEISKTWYTLLYTAYALTEKLKASQWRGRILSTVPNQHMYGLEMSMAFSLASGIQVIDAHPFFPSDIISIAKQEGEPVTLVTTPYHLHSLVSTAKGKANIARIVSATAPLPEELASKAAEMFNAEVIEIYGCSEAGSVATRFPLEQTQWTLLPGFNFEDSGLPARLSGEHLKQVITLEDTLSEINGKQFRLGARSNDMLNVGGKRSSLSEIQERLLAIEGVEDAYVFRMTGQDRPKAVIVGNKCPKEAAIELAKNLDPVFIPRPLKHLQNIPRNTTGKIIKSDIEALF